MNSQCKIEAGQVWELPDGSVRYILSVRLEPRVRLGSFQKVYWTRSARVRKVWEIMVAASTLTADEMPYPRGTSVWVDAFNEWVEANKAKLISNE